MSRTRLSSNAFFACSSSVWSRKIFTKPTAALDASRIAIITPLAQNSVPSRRTCQRSSLARSCASARAASRAGRPLAHSSLVKMKSALMPITSASL